MDTNKITHSTKIDSSLVTLINNDISASDIEAGQVVGVMKDRVYLIMQEDGYYTLLGEDTVIEKDYLKNNKMVILSGSYKPFTEQSL